MLELLEVRNLVFELPIATSVLYVLSMAVGLPLGEHHPHVSLDHPHADLDSTATASSASAGGGYSSILTFLGIGKVPLAISLITGCLVWGVTGLIANQIWKFQHVWPSVGIALATSLVGVKWLSSLLGSLLPTVETYSIPSDSLVGREADVIHEVTAQGGMARLIDSLGTLRDVTVRGAPEQPPIVRGSRVILTAHDPARDEFTARVLRSA